MTQASERSPGGEPWVGNLELGLPLLPEWPFLATKGNIPNTDPVT